MKLPLRDKTSNFCAKQFVDLYFIKNHAVSRKENLWYI